MLTGMIFFFVDTVHMLDRVSDILTVHVPVTISQFIFNPSRLLCFPWVEATPTLQSTIMIHNAAISKKGKLAFLLALLLVQRSFYPGGQFWDNVVVIIVKCKRCFWQIIMDGNARWARQHGRPIFRGHEAGVEALKRAIKWCRALQIPALTVSILPIILVK